MQTLQGKNNDQQVYGQRRSAMSADLSEGDSGNLSETGAHPASTLSIAATRSHVSALNSLGVRVCFVSWFSKQLAIITSVIDLCVVYFWQKAQSVAAADSGQPMPESKGRLPEPAPELSGPQVFCVGCRHLVDVCLRGKAYGLLKWDCAVRSFKFTLRICVNVFAVVILSHYRTARNSNCPE